jgi:hypothetical protein
MNLLVLLIGDNNISNYALIKFLNNKKNKFNKIICVATERTKSNVKNLKVLLKDEEFIELDVEEIKGNFIKVQDTLLNKLNSLNEIKSIFLDFTGGLKSMSLGAYLAVEKYNLKEDYKQFSYIVYNNGRSNIIFKDGNEVELNENLTIDEIAQVHGISDLESENQNSDFYNDKFIIWLLDKVANNEEKFFEELWDKDNLKKLNWKESLANAPVKFDINVISNNKLKKLQQFIRGNFLEEYVFSLLNEMKMKLDIFDIVWNLKKGKEASFEVDVVASKNNNLYLFSCTTDKRKSTVKQKGFEAKERATLMGGRNAKAIIVSCMKSSQKDELKEDLQENKGGQTPTIIIYEDLLQKEILKSKLKDIFK